MDSYISEIVHPTSEIVHPTSEIVHPNRAEGELDEVTSEI
jgi:hypothetical protein